MQQIKFGNMLQMTSGILVHGCNAQGVMGSGIASQIRFRWPEVYDDYRHAFENEGLPLGKVIFTEIDPGQGLYVASAITQQNFGREPKKYCSYEAIYEAFKTIFKEGDDRGISVHYPQIGAGLAGGDWSVIQSCIDAAWNEIKPPHIDRTLWIFE